MALRAHRGKARDVVHGGRLPHRRRPRGDGVFSAYYVNFYNNPLSGFRKIGYSGYLGNFRRTKPRPNNPKWSVLQEGHIKANKVNL